MCYNLIWKDLRLGKKKYYLQIFFSKSRTSSSEFVGGGLINGWVDSLQIIVDDSKLATDSSRRGKGYKKCKNVSYM